MEVKKNTFEILAAINVDEWIEFKPMGKKVKDKKTGQWVDGNFKYLSWMKAWEIVKKHCSDATYHVKIFEDKPYLYDEFLGYLISTSVTINGECLDCWLPVTDGRNDVLKSTSYEYERIKIDYNTKEKKIEIVKVSAATMFDINSTTMRCLAKNFAMHGLGSYLYTGEDLPFLGIDDIPEKEDFKPKSTTTIINKPLIQKPLASLVVTLDANTQLAIDLINSKARLEEFNTLIEQFHKECLGDSSMIKNHLVDKAKKYGFIFDKNTSKFIKPVTDNK